MATLLLRLAAPLQSWGVDSKLVTRRTGKEPTKSGVVGLLAAALGLRRDDVEGLRRLNQLRIAVRVDQEGGLLVDYQTVQGKKDPYVTYRHYLADAVFLVGLESDDEGFLDELEEALRSPAFPLFLGRRSCPPTMPLCLGIRDMDTLEVFRTEPWQGRQLDMKPKKVRVVSDANVDEKNVDFRQDLAVSFNPSHRYHTFRPVKEFRMDVPVAELASTKTEHDPFLELTE